MPLHRLFDLAALLQERAAWRRAHGDVAAAEVALAVYEEVMREAMRIEQANEEAERIGRALGAIK
jgi:hypothetical protein